MKQKYAKGNVPSHIKAKRQKLYLQVGIYRSKTKNMGVPAHTIVSMLIDIVLNLTAESSNKYLKFTIYRYKPSFHIRKEKNP
jgi:hypothetical protein